MIDSPIAGLGDQPHELQVQVPFNPMVNDMALRLVEIERAIQALTGSDVMEPDLLEGIVENLLEEKRFMLERFQMMWDNIPNQAPIDRGHPNKVIENLGEDDAFTDVVVVEEESKPQRKKRAPRKKAPKK